jgi:hypothetical protein
VAAPLKTLDDKKALPTPRGDCSRRLGRGPLRKVGRSKFLNVTLWKARRAGAPIMGLMGRREVTAVDPMNALFGMTMLLFCVRA